jgi:1,4-dihydroxy-6-naphthoate synthase
MKMLSIGYSPCPNDTFIFHALVQGLVREEGLGFKERLEDVEALNSLALAGGLDITKVSFGVVTEVLERYCLLRSGGALGRGCGPLVVAREPLDMSVLRGKRIAVPGKHTTAYLLLKLFDPALSENAVPMAFDLIMDAVRAGEVHAGLIIHEGRFTYPSYGLKEVLDLGRWWEDETGEPIPLGGIIARRELGAETIHRAESLIRKSLEYARSNPDASSAYIQEHAREMDAAVIREHIALYVNEFSLNLGEEGEKAVRLLFKMARERGLLKGAELPLFVE